MEEVIINTDIKNLKLFSRGKVRDTYDLGDYLLLITTDRISAFDFVLSCGIPEKGKVLNQISAFWFEQTRNIIPNHLVETIEDVRGLDKYIPLAKRFIYPSYLTGRAMVVKKARTIPVECIVRGYLAGSAWNEYRLTGTVFGVSLPANLRESEELPQPLFTPTTKAETGHDEPISAEDMRNLIGEEVAEEITSRSTKVYQYAREFARKRGIIIADTKFEYGIIDGKITLIDEILTPDSSRLWDTKFYRAGQAQPSYDKQLVRDWLVHSGWNQEPPFPELPADVIRATTQRYLKAFEKITGRKLV